MKKLFILEDEKIMSRMYSQKFTEAGYEVEMCSDGKDAVKKVKKFKPTMILSDIMVPGISGLDFLKAIKDDSELKKVPFVFLTNLSRTNEDIERGLELGAVGYLVKSDMTPDEVVAKVKEYMDAHASTEDLPDRADERLEKAKKAS